MKILLVTSFFPPTHTAGTEKRTFGYAKTFLERGYDVQVLCAGDWETGDQYWNGHTDEVYEGIPVRRIHFNWMKSPDPNFYLYRNPLVYEKLLEWLPIWAPDLVHITSCITLSASVIEAAKEHDLPVVLTLTDFWFLCPKLNLLRHDETLCDGIVTSQDCVRCMSQRSDLFRKVGSLLPDQVAVELLYRIGKTTSINRLRGLRGIALNIDQRRFYLTAMINLADIITAPSNHLRKTFHKTGVTQAIRLVQSGHDLSWLESDTEKSQGEKIRFGYIGQIVPAKGMDMLVSAYSAENFDGQAELHIYGDPYLVPNYYQHLQESIHANKGSIFFHGPFPHKDLGKILADIDILIVPSLWHENNPRVVQEAFASKTPVIGSNVGGIAEYVHHNINGLLFQRGDSEDLKRQIQRIIAEPSQIQQLADQIPRVKSIQEEMDEIEAIYHQITLQTEAEKL